MFTMLYNLVTRSIIVLLVAMLSVNYLPNQLFKDFNFEPRSLEPYNYESVIPQWNSKLSDKSEYIHLNNILGPESVAIAKNGLLYTGLADGRIVELDPSNKYKLRQVLRFKQLPKCKDNIALNARDCGRFLQLRFVNETLYAVEAGSGLYKIDTKKGTKTLVGPTKPIGNLDFYNSFAFDPKEPNLVYITISSGKHALQSIVWSLLELDSTGKVIALDMTTGKRVVVLDNLMMTNGIDVDAKRDQLIFAETTKSSISKVALQDIRSAMKTAKDGSKLSNIPKATLIPLLPGNPDNIHIDGDMAYIALPFVKLNGKELVDHLFNMPTIRKSYARLVFGAGTILEYVCENLYHHPLLETVYKELKTGHFNYRIIQNDKSAVVEYNLSTGSSRLLGSNTFSFLSEAIPDGKGNLFLGSFRSPFLVKVKL